MEWRQRGRELMSRRGVTQALTTVTDRIEKAKDLFEIPEGVTYLNCANMAPQLRSITKTGIDAVLAKTAPWKLSAPEWFSGAEELRNLAARLLGSDVRVAPHLYNDLSDIDRLFQVLRASRN